MSELGATGESRDVITADAEKIAVRFVGEGKPPIVVLSGGPLRTSVYLGDLGGLSRRRSLAMPELPVLPANELVASVEGLRHRLGLDHLDLVAHSAGATVALQYAATHPERLRRLVLVTPSTRAVGLTPDTGDVVAAVERRRAEPWYPAARAALEAQERGDRSAATHLAAAPFYYGRWDDIAREHAADELEQRSLDAMAIFYADGALDPQRTREGLSHTTARVLIVGGELDLVPNRAMLDELSGLFPAAEVAVLAGAGHYPWLDDPSSFRDTVEPFLAS